MKIDWLRHAFAVDKPGPAEPTSPQKEVVDKICRQIVKRHLATPSLVFLEMSRPLNFIGSQVMHFFAPFVSALTDSEGHRHFALFLEKRGSIDFICHRIEELEEEAVQKENHQGIRETESSETR
jgi:hypothetical protein